MMARKKKVLTAQMSPTLCFSLPTLCPIENQAGDLSQYVTCLPSMCEALGLNPSNYISWA